jgi:hypothetical protein
MVHAIHFTERAECDHGQVNLLHHAWRAVMLSAGRDKYGEYGTCPWRMLFSESATPLPASGR